MLLIIHVVLAFIAITAAADICYEFSALERYNPASTCGSAVDYQFYLNSNTTLAALDYAARVLLSDQKFALSSTQCLKNYKKLVCSNIYSKCEPGLMFSDKATYNHIIFPNYPVPFTRPCKNVCTNVVDSCYGLFKPNCSELFDYSFGNYHITSKLPTRYDSSNNPGLCNVVPSIFTVAATSEPYLYQESGACSGLVTDVYIPPGYILDASLPYLSPQYEIQSITESKLVDAFSQIPVYIDSDCHFAFRKYFCGMYM